MDFLLKQRERERVFVPHKREKYDKNETTTKERTHNVRFIFSLLQQQQQQQQQQ